MSPTLRIGVDVDDVLVESLPGYTDWDQILRHVSAFAARRSG
jgi:hypothetical protein